MDQIEKGKDFHGQLERLVKEFSNSESPITLKMLTLEEFSKEILIELASNPELDEKIDPLLAAIEPTDFSAKRLKLELANFLQRPETIIDYIQTEEKLLIDRALQFSWIFKAGASRLSNPKFLMEHLFPKVSYSVRTRITYRLAKFLNDEKRGEVIFKAIESKYGWSAALPLLQACTVEFIRLIMEANRGRCQLRDEQLLTIAKKDLKIVLDYVEWNAKREQGRVIDLVRGQTLKYILQNNPKEFIRFCDVHHDTIGCYVQEQNRKRTKMLIELDPTILTQEKFSGILNKDQLMKSLTKEQMQDFFALNLPESVEKFKEEINNKLSIIKRYPSNAKLEMVRYAFQKEYGLKLSENLEYMTPSLIELLVKEVEEREKIVDWKLETKDEGRSQFTAWETLPSNRLGFWYSFYGTEKGVAKIKELISSESDVNGRSELIPYLVNICWYNGRDIKALISVCKYVASRFRNDQYTVRQAFMSALKDKFNLRKLMDKELFSVYLELVKLMILNDEPDIYEYLGIAVEYSLKNDLPVESFFLHYIKSKVSKTYSWCSDEWKFASYESELQKRFLILALDSLAVTYPLEKPLATLDNELTYTIASLVDSISKTKYKSLSSEKISITSYPWLIGRIMELLENDCEVGNNAKLQKFIIRCVHKDMKARSMLYDDLLQSCPFPDVVNHFAWREPLKLIANLDSVLLFILHQKNTKEYKRFFVRIKTQGFPDLSAKIVEKCLETAEDESVDIVERKNAIQILPLLWETQNCLNLISYFYPPQSKLDVTEENYEVLYEMRKSIATSFASLAFPATTFPSLIRFCTGDYLKLAVNSLYSICLHSPQSDAIRFLKEELLDRPVSVKKHTIRLVSKIAVKEDIPEFLSYLWSENEANVSIREAILVAMFQLLVDEPSKENWNLLKTTVESLTGKDKACLSALFQHNNISAIPSEYLSSYLSTCWKLLNTITCEDDKIIKSMKVDLVNHLISQVEYIPGEFLDRFISENLFGSTDCKTYIREMAELAAEYITIRENPMKSISEAFEQLLKSSKPSSVEYIPYEASTWYDDYANVSNMVIPVYFTRKVVYNFIIELCNKSLVLGESKQKELQVEELKTFFVGIDKRLKDVQENLKKVASDPADIFKEEFLLTLTMIFLDESKASPMSKSKGGKGASDKKTFLNNVGLKLGNYFDLIVTQWNPSIVELVCDNLRIFFDKCYPENLLLKTDVIYIAHGMLHSASKISLENQLILSKILPVPSTKEATLDTKYKELYSYIANSSHKLVRVSFFNRLSKYY